MAIWTERISMYIYCHDLFVDLYVTFLLVFVSVTLSLNKDD